MEFETFVRKPFKVEAIEVTVENIEELAPMIGELKYRDHRPYIEADRQRFPTVNVVYPGFWITKMGKRTQVYTRKSFANQFVKSGTEISDWVDFIEGKAAETDG